MLFDALYDGAVSDEEEVYGDVGFCLCLLYDFQGFEPAFFRDSSAYQAEGEGVVGDSVVLFIYWFDVEGGETVQNFC